MCEAWYRAPSRILLVEAPSWPVYGGAGVSEDQGLGRPRLAAVPHSQRDHFQGPFSLFSLQWAVAWGELPGGNPEALTILEEEDGGQTLAPLPTARPHCPSPSSACWRTTTLIGASPALCCPWAPPSTWTALHSTKLWPPSSSRRSTTMSWTSARSSPSGAPQPGGVGWGGKVTMGGPGG